jgi:glycosyltransferase involved in cell wall biosynthesis
MRVSILIPTLNRRAFLPHALTTAREQTLSAFEILVSDDGSTDGTRDYVKRIAAADPRVRLLTSNPTPGIFTNINHLVAQSSGDAFCLLGDDDRLAAEYLEQLSAPLDADPDVVASFCDHRIIDANGRVASEATALSSEKWGRTALPVGVVQDPLGAALRQSLCIGFALFRSATFRSRPFDLDCGVAADVDYAIRAATLGQLYYVPRALGDYCHHSGTATRTQGTRMAHGLICALRKHRFSGAHERTRIDRLKRALLSHAVLSSPTNARACLGSLAAFIQLGGSPVNPRVLLAATAALTPRLMAERLEPLVRATHARVRGLAG